MMTLQELQPYFSATAAILGLTTLGFVIRLAAVIRSAERARADIIAERLQLSEERRSFSEEKNQKKNENLTAENEKLRSQLEEALSGSGITIDTIAVGATINQLGSDIASKIDNLIGKMEKAEDSGGGIRNPSWHLELAKGYMAKRRWNDAAEHFDAYVSVRPEDFRSQLTRGVAYANMRAGNDTNLMALRAYNEAITFADSAPEDSLKARLFVYRGAMLKRLGRLKEAEADLLIGKSLATEEYEKRDAEYNLACVFAMKNDRVQLFRALEALRGADRELRAIRGHLDDYFKNFANDEEFRKLIGDG